MEAGVEAIVFFATRAATEIIVTIEILLNGQSLEVPVDRHIQDLKLRLDWWFPHWTFGPPMANQ